MLTTLYEFVGRFIGDHVFTPGTDDTEQNAIELQEITTTITPNTSISNEIEEIVPFQSLYVENGLQSRPEPPQQHSPSPSLDPHNYKYNYFVIFLVLLPFLVIYGIFTKIFFCITRSRLLIVICVAIFIIPPLVILFINIFYHHHHYNNNDDIVKFEMSNVSSYQFDIQPNSFSYNINFSINIFSYYDSTPVDVTANISLLYKTITIGSVNIYPFSLNSTHFKVLNFTLFKSNINFKSDNSLSNKNIYLYLLIQSEVIPRTGKQPHKLEVGCNIEVIGPPRGYMTSHWCAQR